MDTKAVRPITQAVRTTNQLIQLAHYHKTVTPLSNSKDTTSNNRALNNNPRPI